MGTSLPLTYRVYLRRYNSLDHPGRKYRREFLLRSSNKISEDSQAGDVRSEALPFFYLDFSRSNTQHKCCDSIHSSLIPFPQRPLVPDPAPDDGKDAVDGSPYWRGDAEPPQAHRI